MAANETASRQRLLLYGDQFDNTVPCIKNLYRQAKASALLKEYLRGCSDMLQVQVASLERVDRKGIPPFYSILDLAEKYSRTNGSSLFISLLLCYIARIGELIVYAENDPTLLTSRMTIIGLCVGLIPATIGAAARDVTELVDLGIEFVPFCVRVAATSVARARQLEETQGCWGYVIRQLPSDELRHIINEFHRENDIPVHQHACISVLGLDWFTVCGPPSTLSHLLSWSHRINQCPRIPMPIAGLAHVPQLPPDLDNILGSSPMLDRSFPAERITMMPTSTCEPFEGTTIRAVLLEVLKDGLERPLRLVDAVTATFVRMLGNGDVDITCVGPTMQLKSMEKALQSANITYKITANAQRKPSRKVRGGSGLIAVVGMAGQFPQSDNIKDFWKIILEGIDTHTTIPSDRFPLEEFYDPSGKKKNSTTAQHGCFLKKPGVFDTRLFNVSPREAFQMDPVQRLLLMTSHEALENAGFSPNATPSMDLKRIAVYVGQCTEQWRDISTKHGVDIFGVQGLLRVFAPGRLNYHFKFEGASYSLDAACSSSLTAISLACSALQDRDCDMALAGGAQLCNTPFEFAGLSGAGFLSETGGCKTFRADADGYCRGEGVGMIILKRLEDAVADNDNIHAVISGWGRNHSANAVSITHPHAETQQRLYRKILQQACVEPEDITYIEMHGTGTQVGDSIEMDSVTGVFAQHRSADNQLYVGAGKANFGHSEAASGVTAVAKTCMMLKEGIIPPQVGMPNKQNPAFPPLANMHVRIATEKTPLKASPGGDGKKRVFINNFDAAGGNTCLLMEEGPAMQSKTLDLRGWHVIAVSARTASALKSNKQRLLDYLTANRDTKLADLAYSTTARRMHNVLRTAYTVSTVESIIQQLQSDLQKPNHIQHGPKIGGVVFIFTGQGSQYHGMGHELYNISARFRNKIESLQKLATFLRLPSFVEIIADPAVKMGEKSATQVQLAVLCLELALAELWMSWGIKPTLLIGHSLGEYAALCVAGVLATSDTLFLVGKRAALVQEKTTVGEYSMLSTLATVDEIQSSLGFCGFGTSCQIACYNATKATVVSGKTDRLQDLDAFLSAKGIQTKFLQVPYGFHSPQMDPILEDFEASARSITFAKPNIPIMSTLTGQLVKDGGVFNAPYLAKQARQPVRFMEALQSLQAQMVVDEDTIWIEVGPNPVCTGFLRATLNVPISKVLAPLKSGEPDYKGVSSLLAQAYQAGLHIDWPDFHREHLGSLTFLELPTYAFDVKDYWDVYNLGITTAMGFNAANDRARAAAEAPPQPKFSTTTLQRIESEIVNSEKVSVIFESSTAEEKLFGAIIGHLVNGAALCPTSVFSDMANSAATYIWRLANPGKPMLTRSLCDLEIFNALVMPSNPGKQAVRITAIAAKNENWTVHVAFSSSNGDGKFNENGKCSIKFCDASKWKAEWAKNAHLVKARMDAIMSPANAEHVHRLQRPLIYKLFNTVVKYDEKYQGLHEVFMDETMQDAVAVIKLRPMAGTGNWTISPYWSDAIVHLAGFVVNGSSQNPDDMAHISGGFDAMTLADDLSEDKVYHSYVRMRSAGRKGASIGDVYVLDGSQVVAYCEGVKFQQMKKSILNVVLGINEPPADFSATKYITVPEMVFSDKSSNCSTTSSADEEPDDGKVLDAFISTIISETGFDAEEVDDSVRFSDMGVDSLMSIAIIDAVKKKTGVTLPVSLFIEMSTVGDVKKRFGTKKSSTSSVGSEKGESDSRISLEEPHKDTTSPILTSSEKEISPPFDISKYASNVVLLQGDRRSSKTPLFLICDGAGSASAYIHIPLLPSGTPVCALESPFLRCPLEFTCSLEEVCQLYREALKVSQPSGPYLIGGWSAGAVYAYEVSRQLLELGDEVQGLLLIDMKVPRLNLSIMAPTMDVVEQANLVTLVHGERVIFGDLSQMVKDHLLASSLCVRKYDPKQMPLERRPTYGTFIIWARWGLCDTLVYTTDVEDATKGLPLDPTGKNVMFDNDLEMRTFLFSKRHDFGINGWDNLVGSVETVVIDGDHFSIMRRPHVIELGENIQKALKKFAA